jgi:hypothetical protein
MGSRFKIDASYLSPNVNVSNQLESATKSYGSKIILKEYLLISEDIYKIFSPLI